MDRPIAMEPRIKRHLALLLLLMVAASPVSADQDNVRCLRSIGVNLNSEFSLALDLTAIGHRSSKPSGLN